ncbi:MAG: acyltransferase [Bacteroidales bacterium]|nr:acyltransferase [Bacteroidales bacterium]
MTAKTHQRIDELDFLKCIMIVLMVAFHLVYFEELYPYAKQVVYTFHMPVLLIISGYLTNIDKSPLRFLKGILWLFVPYAIMECGYIWMSSLLPIRDHIDHLTASVFFDKLFLHPLGPYWYLHALILCGLTYYAVFRWCPMRTMSRCVLLGLIFAGYAYLGILSLSRAFYFLAGVVVHQSRFSFLEVFRPSWLAVVGLALLVIHPDNLHADVVGGVLIVYLVMSFCLAWYPVVRGRLRTFMLFLGRNTMPIFVFSPLFTILCKFLVPYLAFDKTGLLFLVISLTVSISGSLAIGWVMDRLRVSPYFFGKKAIDRP